MDLHQIIRARKTEKILAPDSITNEVPADLREQKKALILEGLATAGWAPFHYPRDIEKIAEPWRAHILWDEKAHQTASYLKNELKLVTKEPALTQACHCLVLATWIPESEIWSNPETPIRPEVLARDEEHLAASSAMVQNFLLTLTAAGLGNYWSSGGKFRSPEVLAHLGVPSHERLLAAIFIEYPELKNDACERKAGAHRDKRSTDWIREIS